MKRLRHIKTFGLFESDIKEKAVPFEDIINPDAQQGLLQMDKSNPISKILLLYDFDDKKVLAYAKLRKWNARDNFWQIDMTVAEKNYGPDLYDLIMMSVYPEAVRPSTTIKPAAQNVWRFYDEKRSDVKKERIEEEDDNYEDAYEDDDKSGPLEDPAILKLVNTKFSLSPDDNYKILLSLGDEYVNTYGVKKSDIFRTAHKYFWDRYNK